MMKTFFAIAPLLVMVAVGHVQAGFDPVTFIESELDAGKKSVTVPPGVYRLTPKGDVYLRIKNLSGVTIDFTNVEFLGTVNTRMIEIENCADLTMRGLVIDYDPLPFTQARIINVDSERNWTVKIIEGYPIPTVKSGDRRIQVFGRESLELVNPLRFKDGIAITRLDQDTYRITGGENRSGELGDIVVFNCSNYEGGRIDTVCSSKCQDLRFENFTIYSSPDNFGFNEQGNTRSVYQNCRIERRPPAMDTAKSGIKRLLCLEYFFNRSVLPETDTVKRGIKRLRSVTADAFHCKDDPVGPRIIGCTARHQGDDCVNISGMYSVVVGSENNELRLLSIWGAKTLSAGDSIQIMTYDGQCPPDAMLLSIAPDGQITDEENAFIGSLDCRFKGEAFKSAFKAKVDRAMSLPRGSVIISNNRSGNDFVIKDCDFGNIRSRGLLIKASNGIIENNTISDCWVSGIQVSPEYYWMEGGCSRDLKIIGNRLSGNRVAIGISGISGMGKPLPENSHRNIAIRGNTIKSTSALGIEVAGCAGLDITGNSVEVVAKRSEEAICLRNVSGVTQKDNTVKLLPPPAIPKRDFLPRLKIVAVGKKPLYEDGKVPGIIEIEGASDVAFEFIFSNEGSEAAPCRAQVFLHFDDEDGQRAMDAGYSPSVATCDWRKDRQIVDSKTINIRQLKGRTCRLYAGLFYSEDGGDRVILGNTGQVEGERRLFVGTLKIN